MDTFITPQSLAEILLRSEEEPILIYKHSLTCPISRRAMERMIAGISTGTIPYPTYIVKVQPDRALSDQIAATLGIRHESPQVILLSKGKAVYDASHGDIKAANIPHEDGSVRTLAVDTDGAEIPNICYDIDPE